MTGWLVLYAYPIGPPLPRHYQTEKMAVKFAEAHRALGYAAIVVNIEDLMNWINTGVGELERMFRL